MSCRRICRELVELFRFGELDRRSAPHLEHLAACRSCRDEVGFDRELVDRLRTALAQRIEHEGPSGSAFAAILARAQSDEPMGWRRWLRLNPSLLAERLRAASGVAVVGLAVLLTAGTQLEIVQAPVDTSGEERSSAVAAAAWSAGIRAGRGVDAETRNGNVDTIAAAPRQVIPPLAEPGLVISFFEPDEEAGEPRILVTPQRVGYAMLGEEEPEVTEPDETPVRPAPPMSRVDNPS
jgi:hypothetical protein